ncbi:four-carbon acid sugar kinase family protein [Pontibacillus yanchengensis]|uniref:Four-carbon acid sugar kinase family protein n=2 Tax=Pontibacillus yanchengensis TaxID=462910 RepID=A0ACC7VI19_9BACI|nr:four-carbon acid sugar kinase family protein [Pontibacillus yanchengensis]MYL34353.1 four-carbon acid sugar kinase family protein [Pontibacillus yanchengensis]MYL53821.1 four-carbon acid sugar kinase family protein [Pontibacillus yanchengensis]
MDIAVVCDDLTGSNATGVKLSKNGFRTATVVHGLPLPEGYEALCMDTDSRYVSPNLAKRRVRQILEESATKDEAKMYSKRVDSTFRGNIGAEMEEMLDFLGEDSVAIVVSSFPESGRYTVGGYLLVDDIPLQETDVAKDPVAPIETSQVTKLIQNQTDLPISSIGLHTVMEGKEALEQEIATQLETSRIISIDALTDHHIELISQVMTTIDRPVLSVDPGPLTAAYAKNVTASEHTDKKYVLTVGSATNQTGQQLSYFIDKWKVNPVYVQPKQLATFTSSWQDEVDRVVQEVDQQIAKERFMLITTYHPGQEMLDLEAIAERENTSEESLAKRITDGLSSISRKVIEKNRDQIAGCYLSGGDVTASLCSIVRARGIELEDEVMPLAAFGKFVGGYLDGMYVVTKGGMIGDKKAIATCMNYLVSATHKQ